MKRVNLIRGRSAEGDSIMYFCRWSARKGVAMVARFLRAAADMDQGEESVPYSQAAIRRSQKMSGLPWRRWGLRLSSRKAWKRL